MPRVPSRNRALRCKGCCRTWAPCANADAVAAHAVKVNVFHTMNFLLRFSESIREAVRSGQIEIHGGIYDLETGSVEFLGKSPQQTQLLESSMPVPPSMSGGAAADHGVHGVRTGADFVVKPEAALKLLQQGNERFAAGAPTAATTSRDMRQALVKCGQAPHSAILGCADSRVPVDTVFDAMPGDLFVLRNAGNTCTHAARQKGALLAAWSSAPASWAPSWSWCWGTRSVAPAGATKTFQAGECRAWLEWRSKPARTWAKGVEEAKLIAHAVKVNVFHSILLKFSVPLRDLVRKGNLQIQGGIYHLDTGRVEFLGRSPQQAELLSSKRSVPPSIQCGPVRTAQSEPVMPQDALAMLKDGNERFAVGSPHCSLPGDLFVLRNAGNTCTHAEGSVLGSLCTGALNTRLSLQCHQGRNQAFVASKKSGGAKKDGHALDSLLRGLSSVEETAASIGATEDSIAQHAVKVNVFHTINFMLQHPAQGMQIDAAQ
ncbi:mtcA2 [Symbiodinium pilosum]|uniref:carbonic anhydrase n=1 Tax=Symbiodinium pilosum TaxID=2952 RepID=A0A812SIR5_SYMPI|nr:mtcA2 [Symbiodinium pilosum]